MTTLARTRLLIVDADQDERIFLRRRLSGLGYAVTEAAGHGEALSQAATGRFDLALLDLRTAGPGGAGGLDLVRALRQRRGPAEMRIMAIAETAALEDAAEALERGADDCLFRPLYIDAVQTRAAMLVGREAANAPNRSTAEALDSSLSALEHATTRTEAVAAGIEALGFGRFPINGLLGASTVLTRICRKPDLTRAIGRIETAAAALDLVMVRALGRADRRSRAPKSQLRILLVGRDEASCEALRTLARTAEVEVELIVAADGSAAVRATDAGFFDLIVIDLVARRAMTGIKAIRQAERQNRVRRTPLLAIGSEDHSPTQARDAGCDLYMQHPVTAERLLGALADALARDAADVRAVA